MTFSGHEELRVRVNDTKMRKMALALNGGLTQRGEASLSWEPSHVCVLDLLIKIQFPRRSPSPTLPPPRSTSLRLWGRRSRPEFFCAVSDELGAKKPARAPTTTDRRIEREWLIHGLSVHVKQSLRNSRKFRNSDGSVTNQQNHCTDLPNR